MDSFIIIIRATNERTLPVLINFFEERYPDKYYLINEKPFTEALQICFEKALASDCDWLITIDADVLPIKKGIEDLLTAAKTSSLKVFQIESLVFDKLLNRYRYAGNRIYRVSYLQKALNLFDDRLKGSIRPESSLLELMHKQGFISKRVESIFGLHDFEQYYKDIFAKAFLHANKHLDIAGTFLPHWKSKQETDTDFKFALLGFCAGLKHTAEIPIDRKFFDKFFLEVTRKENIVKKGSMNNLKDLDLYIDSIIKQKSFRTNYTVYIENENSEIRKLKALIAQYGIKKGIGFYIIRALGMIARTI
jgi:hypothetical protein